MGTVKTGDKVKVHYTGTLKDGSQFDSSEGRDPLEFVLGAGKVISGFDKAVMGLKPGEKCKVDIPCKEAYGEHSAELVMEFDRDQFPVDVPLEIGQHFKFETNEGQTQVMQVSALDDKIAILDGNHPLAGKDLTFEITLVEIC